jgi:hypothetical protein
MFLPVIVVCLAALALALLIAPLVLLAAIVNPHAVWKMLKTFGHFAVFFFKSRGTHIELNNERDNILIYHK